MSRLRFPLRWHRSKARVSSQHLQARHQPITDLRGGARCWKRRSARAWERRRGIVWIHPDVVVEVTAPPNEPRAGAWQPALLNTLVRVPDNETDQGRCRLCQGFDHIDYNVACPACNGSSADIA